MIICMSVQLRNRRFVASLAVIICVDVALVEQTAQLQTHTTPFRQCTDERNAGAAEMNATLTDTHRHTLTKKTMPLKIRDHTSFLVKTRNKVGKHKRFFYVCWLATPFRLTLLSMRQTSPVCMRI